MTVSVTVSSGNVQDQVPTLWDLTVLDSGQTGGTWLKHRAMLKFFTELQNSAKGWRGNSIKKHLSIIWLCGHKKVTL